MHKIKQHFKKHKTVYIAGGSSVVFAGITYLIMRDPNPNVLRAAGTEVPRATVALDHAQTGLFIFANHSTVTTGDISATVHNGTRGHPGFITRCVETGELFLTQRSAAESVGASKSIMSGHLNGKLDDVNGMHFERVSPTS